MQPNVPFETIDAKNAKRIPPVKGSPELTAEMAKIQELEASDSALTQDIVEAERSQTEPRSPAQIDAECVLNGRPLPDQIPRTRLEELRRQREATRNAIPIARGQADEVRRQIISRNLPAVEPIVRKYVGAVVRAAGELETAIQHEEAMFAFLRIAGYRDVTPAFWTLLPSEHQILAAIDKLRDARQVGFGQFKE